MDPVEALHVLLAQHDEVDLERAYLEKFGIDCGAFANLLHLQGAINSLVTTVERHRDGY